MTKYSTGDEVYATPGCLTQQQDIPAIGGQFPRDIRRYLRSNRYQDSAPERRADVEGLYQFPACCSCCKCPTCVERLPGAESPQRRLRINDGDDGGFGIGEGDGFFDGGGYVGFSANEDHYIHMISDEKKAYMRAQCLQQEVRYGFPQVGYISRNEEDEAIVQPILEAWPTENQPIHFIGTTCLVLQRTFVFEDAPLEKVTLFVCNCRCPEGKAGLTIQSEMERTISYCSEVSQDGQPATVNRIDFINNIQRMYGSHRLPRPAGMLFSLDCLECIHTKALRTMYRNGNMIDVPVSPVLEKTAKKLETDKIYTFDIKKAMKVMDEQAKTQLSKLN